MRFREKKTVPYSKFCKLFDTPKCTFYSVQINADATAVADMNRRSNVHDLRDSISDFADTAGIISQTDLVISVDTATAHLAGALGKPVWTLHSPTLPTGAGALHRNRHTVVPYPMRTLPPKPRSENASRTISWNDDLMEEITVPLPLQPLRGSFPPLCASPGMACFFITVTSSNDGAHA